jgi:hypothetical protein
VQRPVHRDVVKVEAHDPVERREGFDLGLLEHPGVDPLVPAGAQGGVGHLVVEDRFDVDPGGAGHQPDQDPPEAELVRYPGPMTAQRVGPGRGREQRLDRRPDGIYHLPFQSAHDDVSPPPSRRAWEAPGRKTGPTQRPVDGHLSARPARTAAGGRRARSRGRSAPTPPPAAARLRSRSDSSSGSASRMAIARPGADGPRST